MISPGGAGNANDQTTTVTGASRTNDEAQRVSDLAHRLQSVVSQFRV